MSKMLRALVLVAAFVTATPPQITAEQLTLLMAINAGGPAHRDSYGIPYSADGLGEEYSTSSDFGRRLDIQRVPHQDAPLYQTERYSTQPSFRYQLPLPKDGNYVLVLKFSEVYFKAPGQKVFDVLLDNTKILSGLDIFRQVGFATAHDEVVSFRVKNKGKTLQIGDKEVKLKKKGGVDLVFQRGAADNPKINAFYLVQGIINDVPRLPPLIPRRNGGESEKGEDIFEDEDDQEVIDLGSEELEDTKIRTFTTGTNKWIRSGPVSEDPWDLESTQDKYLPVGVALLASIIGAGIIYQILKKTA